MFLTCVLQKPKILSVFIAVLSLSKSSYNLLQFQSQTFYDKQRKEMVSELGLGSQAVRLQMSALLHINRDHGRITYHPS